MTTNTKILIGVGSVGLLAFVIYKLTNRLSNKAKNKKEDKEVENEEKPTQTPNSTPNSTPTPKTPTNTPSTDEIDLGLSVYKVVTKGSPLNARLEPSINSERLFGIPNGSLMRAKPSSTIGWHEAYAYNPKGNSKNPYAESWGYVSSKYLVFVSK